MSRLFLSLFAIVFFVVVGFGLTINGVTDFLFQDVIEDIRDAQMGGIIKQLDEEVSGLDEQQRKETLSYLQSLFRYELDLLPLGETGLSPTDRSRIVQGSFVAVTEGFGEIVYHIASLPDQVWKLEVSPTTAAVDRAFVSGVLRIIEERLEAMPKELWPDEIARVDQQFRIPIRLIPIEAPEIQDTLDTDQRKILSAGDSVLIYRDDHLKSLYYQIGHSELILKAGEIEYPILFTYITYIIAILLAVPIGIAIWLWLRPVWQDLRRLQRASDGIAQGQLATRIEISRYSFIKGILQTFNTMAGHIEQLVTSHKMLTNAVSHELRTPVSRLRFSLEMAEKADSRTDRQRYFKAMNADIDELDEMLADLLSYARMDRQSIQLKKSPVVPAQWVRKQLERWQQERPSLEITALPNKLPNHPITCMDPTLMARAVHNLLQNACRYAEHRIQVGFVLEEMDYRLSVEDDGRGIPAEHHATLFDPFTRVDSSRDRDSGGYGLGLAIVKQIVNAHQGTVEIATSELGGALFVLTWPRS